MGAWLTTSKRAEKESTSTRQIIIIIIFFSVSGPLSFLVLHEFKFYLIIIHSLKSIN